MKTQYSEKYAKKILDNLSALVSVCTPVFSRRAAVVAQPPWYMPRRGCCASRIRQRPGPLLTPVFPPFPSEQGLDSVDKKEDMQKFFVSRSVAKLLPRGVSDAPTAGAPALQPLAKTQFFCAVPIPFARRSPFVTDDSPRSIACAQARLCADSPTSARLAPQMSALLNALACYVCFLGFALAKSRGEELVRSPPARLCHHLARSLARSHAPRCAPCRCSPDPPALRRRPSPPQGFFSFPAQAASITFGLNFAIEARTRSPELNLSHLWRCPSPDYPTSGFFSPLSSARTARLGPARARSDAAAAASSTFPSQTISETVIFVNTFAAAVVFGTNVETFLQAVREQAGIKEKEMSLWEKALAAVSAVKVVEALTSVRDRARSFVKEEELMAAGGAGVPDPRESYFRLAALVTVWDASRLKKFDAREWEMTEKEAVRIAKVFNRYDSDSNGMLGLSELQALTRDLGHELSAAEATVAMEYLDEDNNGTVEFNEFVGWWTGVRAVKPPPGGGEAPVPPKVELPAVAGAAGGGEGAAGSR